jgi:hypothetical protein
MKIEWRIVGELRVLYTLGYHGTIIIRLGQKPCPFWVQYLAQKDAALL